MLFLVQGQQYFITGGKRYIISSINKICYNDFCGLMLLSSTMVNGQR
jgi:hypothetical protein